MTRRTNSIGRRTQRSTMGGYSLMEMLVTLIVIQAIAGMIGISVSSVASTERLSFTAQEIISAIRYARQLAQTSGTPCGVIFDSVNQQVKVFRGSASTIAPNAAMPGGQYIINLLQQVDTGGVQLTTISLAGCARQQRRLVRHHRRYQRPDERPRKHAEHRVRHPAARRLNENYFDTGRRRAHRSLERGVRTCGPTARNIVEDSPS